MNEVVVNGQTIVLNEDHMRFNEANLGKYMEEEHVWYNYYGQALADLEFEVQLLEVEYETLYYRFYKDAKESGSTDKLAEASAKQNVAIVDLRNKLASRNCDLLKIKQFLKAFDKAHDNAKSRAFSIQKEIDKLNHTFKGEMQELVSAVIGS